MWNRYTNDLNQSIKQNQFSVAEICIESAESTHTFLHQHHDSTPAP